MEDKNIVNVNYHTTGKSTDTNNLGMRAMQARVYKKRASRYLLVKAPPASGKSRALMFVALDKLANQGIKKAIIAVPERSIGRSFRNTELMKHGFYEDWQIDPYYDLTTGGSDGGNVKRFIKFLNDPDAKILICTHATLRFAYEQIEDDGDFNDLLVAIDEFHHVSAADNSVLGNALRNIMYNSSAHIIAMTGSYFRGDTKPILTTEDERKFDKVNYSYYEQLDGYQYLKSFSIDYKFYQGSYLDALDKAIDTSKKTIIHIPNVNSAESTKDKYEEVGHIQDTIGEFIEKDPKTGIDHIKRPDGTILKVADLVTEEGRDKVQNYLRKIDSADDLDIIIALGMAKEGFDWPWAEHSLTIGNRNSLTEVVQIIGRITRDCEGKPHAQFTNLIAQPNAQDDDVIIAVNTMLKAVTAALLMEQVLTTELKISPAKSDETNKRKLNKDDSTITIKGLANPSTQKVRDIIENDLPDLKAAILQDNQVQRAIASNTDPSVINKVLVPKVIMEKDPSLSDKEIEEIRQYTVADMVLKPATTQSTTSLSGDDKKFLRIAGKFINVDELDINLVDSINPFQRAYEVMSDNIDSKMLRLIQQTIDSKKIDISDEELMLLAPQILQFIADNDDNYPSKDSSDPLEVKYAYALAKLRDLKLRRDRRELDGE